MTLKLCISDGSEIIIDGFDEIYFYSELPIIKEKISGYAGQRESYDKLMNNLCKYNFIGILRNNPNDELEYRNHSFAFKNKDFTKNETLILRTSSITTVIDMYN